MLLHCGSGVAQPAINTLSLNGLLLLLLLLPAAAPLLLLLLRLSHASSAM
jgi:hypothetical protein